MLIANFNYFKEASIVTEVDINGAPAGDDAGGGESPDFTGEPVSTVGNDGGNPPEDGGDNTPEDTGGEETEDFTDNGDDASNPEEGENAGSDDTEDFTDDGGGDNMEDGDAGGEDNGGDTGAAPAGDGSTQADDARGLENEIFADLTPTQIAVKHKELKNNFNLMHDSIDELINRVNEVNAAEYQSAITFVSQQLSDLKEMIADYVTDVYSTKSYMENAMNYNRFLATLNGIKEILDEVSNRVDVKNNDSSDSSK